LKDCIIALAAGALVGVIYGLINVRSPAPPIIGLVGLVGILLGEQAVLLAKRVMNSEPITISLQKGEGEVQGPEKQPAGSTSALPFVGSAPKKPARSD
jgi:XapX domain-containing protein